MILTERQVMDAYGLSKKHIDQLIEAGLPCTRLFEEKEVKAALQPQEIGEQLLRLGEFQNVHMLPSELCKLNASYGEDATKDLIEQVSRWYEQNPKKFRPNSYLTIRNWAGRKGVPERDPEYEAEKEIRERQLELTPEAAEAKRRFEQVAANFKFGGDEQHG